jgi:hypothetical protein
MGPGRVTVSLSFACLRIHGYPRIKPVSKRSAQRERELTGNREEEQAEEEEEEDTTGKRRRSSSGSGRRA